MKVCKYCGNVAAEGIKFCSNCGGEFDDIKNQNNTNNSSAADVLSGNPFDVDKTVFVSQEAKKKTKKQKRGLKIAIAVSVLIIISAIGSALEDYYQEQKGLQDNFLQEEYDGSYDDLSKPFTYGEVNDGVYTNKWANLKLVIPDGFEVLSNDETSELYGSNLQKATGFSIVKGGSSFVFAIEDKAFSLRFTDSTDYLEYLLEDAYDELDGLDVDVSISEPKICFIAEREFVYSHILVSNIETGRCQSLYITEIDGRMAMALLTSDTADENEAMVSKLEALN